MKNKIFAVATSAFIADCALTSCQMSTPSGFITLDLFMSREKVSISLEYTYQAEKSEYIAVGGGGAIIEKGVMVELFHIVKFPSEEGYTEGKSTYYKESKYKRYRDDYKHEYNITSGSFDKLLSASNL